MPSTDNGASLLEEPWVTELLRDILQEESFTPVWRHAVEYHPCEKSALEAIRMLPTIEQEVIHALYKEELPLTATYAKLDISAAVAGNTLSHALAQLHKPCLLRIILKGAEACERESSSLSELSAEDVLLLGVETLSLSIEAYDIYVTAGVQTIENLMCLLIYGSDECKSVPSSIQEQTRHRLEELNLWAPLRRYLLSEENQWWQRLYLCAVAACRRPGDITKPELTKAKMLSAIASLPEREGKALTSLYTHGASELMFAFQTRMSEEAVEGLHHQSLVELAHIIGRRY